MMMIKYVTYEDSLNNRIFNDYVSKRLVVMIPCHNEEDSIGRTLKSLSLSSLPEGIIMDVFIALDNCTDDTEGAISEYEDKLNLYLMKTVNNSRRKAGALNQLYQLFYGNMSRSDEPNEMHEKSVNNILYFLGIDADVYLDKSSIITLLNEINKDYKIGAISANYTSLLPEKSSKIPRDDPNRESMIKSHKYSGVYGRFITFCQNMEFADWTIKQKANNYTAEINGGQCSMFRTDAIKEVFKTSKLNGIYSDETDTEDLELTQELRGLGWKCLVSSSARCYVDPMTTNPSFIAQRTKWVSGTIDYMTKAGLSTNYSRRLWCKEFLLMINLFIDRKSVV